MLVKDLDEYQLKNYIHCSNLYNISPAYIDLTTSQLLFKHVLSEFYTLVLKGQLVSFDKQLFLIIKKSINNYYPKALISESQKLVSYLINGVHSFIAHFPLDSFYPVAIQAKKPYLLEQNEITIVYDFLFVQRNKSKFFHGVTFSTKSSPTYSKLDPFIHLKLKCLSNLYPSRRYANPAAYQHVLTLPDIEFNNKNLKTFSLKKFSLSEREVNEDLINSLSFYLNEMKNPRPFIPKPTCFFVSCPKRKECQNDSNLR